MDSSVPLSPKADNLYMAMRIPLPPFMASIPIISPFANWTCQTEWCSPTTTSKAVQRCASYAIKSFAHWPISIEPWTIVMSFAVCTFKTPFLTLSGAYCSAVQAIRKQFLHILIIIQSAKIYIKIKAVLSK